MLNENSKLIPAALIVLVNHELPTTNCTAIFAHALVQILSLVLMSTGLSIAEPLVSQSSDRKSTACSAKFYRPSLIKLHSMLE